MEEIKENKRNQYVARSEILYIRKCVKRKTVGGGEKKKREDRCKTNLLLSRVKKKKYKWKSRTFKL